MKTGRDNLEEALQLLLKLSNKPHFMYVDEVKEVAVLVHTAASQFQSEESGRLHEQYAKIENLHKEIEELKGDVETWKERLRKSEDKRITINELTDTIRELKSRIPNSKPVKE